MHLFTATSMSTGGRVIRGVVVSVVLGVSGLLVGPAPADGADPEVDARIATGAAHTCAVLDAGSVRCWGKGADGRLGHGGVDNIGDGVGPSVEDAGDVPVGAPVAAVTAGEAHTCALLTVGSVRCWGDAADGRLGYPGDDDVGDGEGPSIEDAGDVPLSGAARAVAAGATHTCAALVSGAVECWGAGSSPRAVEGVQDALGLAAGGDHTCVVTDAGAVQCWDVGRDPAPVGLADRDPAVDVAVGETQACAVLDSGVVDCWELDDAGRASEPRGISLARDAVAVAAGGTRACALLDIGAVQCWEAGGSTDGAAVTGDATALAVGPEHACVLIAAEPVCWGSGADGRLGYDDSQALPVPAAAGLPTDSETPGATGQASPGDEVTFGGGSQAEARGDVPRPEAGDSSGSGPSPWLALLVVPVAAVGGWAMRRRRTTRVPTDDGTDES